MTDESAVTAPSESARRQKTRERLIDAAYEVFSEHGLHAASIEMVAEAAGFSRGAFYSNFESKEELFFALAERENGLRLARLKLAVEAQHHVARPDVVPLNQATVETLVGAMLALQADDTRWFLVLGEFRLFAMRDQAVARRFTARQHEISVELAELITLAIASVGARFSLDPYIVAGIVSTTYETAMQQAILSGVDDADSAAHVIAMRTLPALIFRLIEPA
ncbi:TetR/AcrR family transcriptional regulator [Alpinimonas psychrophila]|uniref:AcrR family transcriptional regulator n=1 Tax=Alpinimonas psychrophila TaxID=748908 RepID=A0A7W3JT77_9MICO|nr:TetR/AcrR family transcriptional regulator [Alpinimonas psychrophila]MBA8828790.1 AcrR family transcriptional regulator [Alpinimonas psychrophila]